MKPHSEEIHVLFLEADTCFSPHIFLFCNMLPCSTVCVYSPHFICPNEKLFMGIGFLSMAPRVTLCTILLKTTTKKDGRAMMSLLNE